MARCDCRLVCECRMGCHCQQCMWCVIVTAGMLLAAQRDLADCYTPPEYIWADVVKLTSMGGP